MLCPSFFSISLSSDLITLLISLSKSIQFSFIYFSLPKKYSIHIFKEISLSSSNDNLRFSKISLSKYLYIGFAVLLNPPFDIIIELFFKFSNLSTNPKKSVYFVGNPCAKSNPFPITSIFIVFSLVNQS